MPAEIALPAAVNLIETLGYSRAQGFARLELHLARLARSSRVLVHQHDADAVRWELMRAVAQTEGAWLRVRLEQSPDGGVVVTASQFTPTPPGAVWRASVAAHRLAPEDGLLAHKTTRRAFYDEARMAGGVEEAIFLNTRGEVCEGSITSVFVERGGQLLTPPLSCGLLAGVLRAELLQTGQAVEAVVQLADLADGFFLGNSLRGLIAAKLV